MFTKDISIEDQCSGTTNYNILWINPRTNLIVLETVDRVPLGVGNSDNYLLIKNVYNPPTD